MNTRRTFLKVATGGLVASLVPWVALPKLKTMIFGFPAPEEYTLCMPLADRPAWLDMTICQPNFVPALGTNVLIELRDFGITFDGRVASVELEGGDFKVRVVERMRRDDI